MLKGTIFLVSGLAWLAGLSAARAQADYVSPFTINLSPDIADWTSDIAARSTTVLTNADPAESTWYTTTDYTGHYSFGPLDPQLYNSGTANQAGVNTLLFDRGGPVYNVPINTAPTGVNLQTWQQQRLLYVAQQLIGTHYQHLHMPTFDPGQVTNDTFTWSPVSSGTFLNTTQNLDFHTSGTVLNPYRTTYGSAQPGLDCTDFSAYIYNIALGIQMPSGTATQVTFSGGGSAPTPTNTPVSTILADDGSVIIPTFLTGTNYGTQIINAPGSLDNIIAQLRPGDLLYMQSGGNISHVVVWLGQYGTNPDGSPLDLVISSHDDTPAIFDTLAIDPVTGLPLDGDAAGHLPPPGVEILPFDSSNWFYQNFSLAMQILPVPEPSAAGLLLMGLPVALAFVLRRRTLRRSA